MRSTPRSTTESHRRDDSEVVLVAAADERYVVGLAATVQSALDHLGPRRRLRLFALDAGVEPKTRERLNDAWADARLTAEWAPVDVARLHDHPLDAHASPAVYARLLLAELLPDDVDRAIYLDSDTLVRRDLGALWDTPTDGHVALAVADPGSPVMDAWVALDNYLACRDYLLADQPAPNYQALGVSALAPYFNSGLMLIDVAAWRADDVGPRAFDCLETHRRHVRLWDQYALNAVLAGRWRALDARWNQTSDFYRYPDWDRSPFDRETFRRLRDDPWIVHFSSAQKPWLGRCDNPYAAEYREVLTRTPWREGAQLAAICLAGPSRRPHTTPTYREAV